MATMAIVQTQIDADVEKRAAEVLQREGLTVGEAVRQMLTRTAEDGALPFARETAGDAEVFGDDDPEYDAWFRAQVQEALDDPRPAVFP